MSPTSPVTAARGGDALGTVGLLLFVTAVISAALFLGSFASEGMTLMVATGVAATASLAGSLVCFVAAAEPTEPVAAVV